MKYRTIKEIDKKFELYQIRLLVNGRTMLSHYICDCQISERFSRPLERILGNFSDLLRAVRDVYSNYTRK